MSDLTSNASVKTWLRSAKIAEPSRHLRLLEEFAGLVERQPDEMIAECLKLVQEGQFKLRGKTRRQYVERIEEFEEAHGGRSQGNVIRSFFIHNGIPIQPPILT